MPGWAERTRHEWAPERRAEAVRLIADVLSADPGVRFGVLHGSFARGERFADIDIAVSLDEPWGYLDLGDLARRIDEALGCRGIEADFVSVDAASPWFRFRIAREGLPLYERERWLYPAFFARAIVEGNDCRSALIRAGHPVGHLM